jgi:hypothetical protein
MTDDRSPTEVAADQRRALLEDYYHTFTPEHGKRVLADLRASAFALRTAIHLDASGRIDPYRSLYNEGARAFVVAIEKKLRDALHAQAAEPQAFAVSSTAELES